MASSWFLFFSYHNDARSNRHQNTKGFLQDVINRFLFSLPALSCVAGGSTGLRHYTAVSAIGYDVIKFPAPDLLFGL